MAHAGTCRYGVAQTSCAVLNQKPIHCCERLHTSAFYTVSSLVLSPTSLMFWTNWNEQSPSIMRATLSGNNILVIIGNDIRTPNGLAIDHRAEKLYFSDATLDKIERCEYDGSRRYVSNTGTRR